MALSLESTMTQLEKYGPIHLHLGMEMLKAGGAADHFKLRKLLLASRKTILSLGSS